MDRKVQYTNQCGFSDYIRMEEKSKYAYTQADTRFQLFQ